MTNIYKKIKINWTYPIQPTSLQVGTVKIYRGTSEFTLDSVLSQTELVNKAYDPSFTEFIDNFELQEDTTYYYMIIVYGDIDSTISAATPLHSVKINKTDPVENDLIITCEGATEMALLNINSTENVDATVEIWVNDEYLATVPISQLADSWSSVPKLLQNSERLGYEIQSAETFIGIGLSQSAGKDGIRFKIVPSENGKNSLGPLSTVPGTEQIVNPTSYQDPDSGVIVFCLKKQPDKILGVSFSVINEGSVINLPFGVHTVATGSDVSYSVTSPSNITTVYDDPGTAQDSLSYMRELPFEEGFWSIESSSLSSEIFTPIISYVYIGTARNTQMPTEAVGSLVNNELVITVNMETNAVATLIPNDNNDDPIAYAIPNSNGVATFKIPMTTFDGYIRSTNISHGSQGILFTYP